MLLTIIVYLVSVHKAIEFNDVCLLNKHYDLPIGGFIPPPQHKKEKKTIKIDGSYYLCPKSNMTYIGTKVKHPQVECVDLVINSRCSRI